MQPTDPHSTNNNIDKTKEEVLKELTPKLQEILKDTKPGGMSKKVRASSISKDFQELYNHIQGSPFSNEKIYLCLNSLLYIPTSECGNPSYFIDVIEGYRDGYCRLPKQGPGFCKHCRTIIDSKKDYSKNGYKSDKFKQVMLEKYGVLNISQTEKQKQFLRETSLFSKPEFHEAQKQKMIERFGSEEKYREHLSKLSSEYQSNMTPEEKEAFSKATSAGKIASTFNRKIKSFKNIEPLFDVDSYLGGERKNKYNFKCKTCKFEFTVGVYENKEPECPQCRSKKYTGKSKEEDVFCNWIISQLDPMEFTLRGDRKEIAPLELDLYIPGMQLAFEYCGIYWHQEKYVGKTSHQDKIKICKEKGIRLITVFSDDWKYKKEIVQNRILYFIGNKEQKITTHTISGINSDIFNFNPCTQSPVILDEAVEDTPKINKISARKCTIRELFTSEAQEFFDTYHLQGDTPASVKLGLFYENKLISSMSFSKSRFNKNVQWELIRFASSANVPGSQSKLFKHFLRKYNPESILSYADLAYGYGNSYLQLGFQLDGWTSPDYSYVHENKDYRENRQKFQKHKISNENNKHLTESEIMESLGYYKVYGPGSARYIWRK